MYDRDPIQFDIVNSGNCHAFDIEVSTSISKKKIMKEFLAESDTWYYINYHQILDNSAFTKPFSNAMLIIVYKDLFKRQIKITYDIKQNKHGYPEIILDSYKIKLP